MHGKRVNTRYRFNILIFMFIERAEKGVPWVQPDQKTKLVANVSLNKGGETLTNHLQNRTLGTDPF